MYLASAVAPRSRGERLLESSPRVSVLVHVCDARATRRCVRNALRNTGHKSRRWKQNARVAIDSHISARAWWVLRAVVPQVAGPGGRDADAPVDVAIELCACSDADIDG